MTNTLDISWSRTFLNIAKEISTHSTCVRLQVGAVIVKDKRIISMGYNGVPSGMKHCKEVFKNINLKSSIDRQMHHEFACENELHAEQNAIAFAAKSTISLDKDCTIYLTTEPCNDCAKLIIAANIGKVIYSNKYDGDTRGIDLLRSAGVQVINIE